MRVYTYKASVVIPQNGEQLNGTLVFRGNDCCEGEFTPVAFILDRDNYTCVPVPAVCIGQIS